MIEFYYCIYFLPLSINLLMSPFYEKIIILWWYRIIYFSWNSIYYKSACTREEVFNIQMHTCYRKVWRPLLCTYKSYNVKECCYPTFARITYKTKSKLCIFSVL